VLEVIGAPSRFRLTRKSAALARVLHTFAHSCEETPRGGSVSPKQNFLLVDNLI
jgi:hypothetical protein